MNSQRKVNQEYRQAVSKLEQEYKDLYDNIPIAMWRISLKTHEFLKANISCARLLGYENVDQLHEQNVNACQRIPCEQLSKLLEDSCIVENTLLPFVREDGSMVTLRVTAKLNRTSHYIEGSMVVPKRNKEHEKCIESLRKITAEIHDRLRN